MQNINISGREILITIRCTSNAVLLVMTGLLLSACAGFHPIVPMNIDIEKHQIVVSEKKPTPVQKGASVDIPDTYFGASSNKRGSLTAALMFGPLAVAANYSYVQSETQKMADRVPAIFDIDLSKILTEQGRYPIDELPDTVSKIVVTPAARLYFENDEGTDYSVICTLNVRVMDGTVQSASTSYSLRQQEKFSGQSDETKQRIVRELQKCFADAQLIMKDHLTDKLKLVGYEVELNDPTLGKINRNFQLAEDWLDKRLVARYSRSFIELSRENTKLVTKMPLTP